VGAMMAAVLTIGMAVFAALVFLAGNRHKRW
jgi:hypothetical protein